MFESIASWLPAGLDSNWSNWLPGVNAYAVDSLVVFVLIIARITGTVLAVPCFTALLPMRFRLVLVMAIALIVAPSTIAHGTGQPVPSGVVDGLIACARELMFGLVIGGTIQLLYCGILMAGELIASVMGMQLAQAASPSEGQSVPQMSKLLGLLIVAILFAVGAHRLLLDGLLMSFQRMPPTVVPSTAELAELVWDHLAIGIESGLRVAAPVIAVVLIGNLVVSLISRSLPQLNLLAIGINLNVLGGLAILALTVGAAGMIFQVQVADTLSRLGLY